MSKEMLSEADTLSVERIWGEWQKWAGIGSEIRKSLIFLRDSGWMEALYPELFDLWETEQDPVWHPEGSVMEHTIRSLESMLHLSGLMSWNMARLTYLTFATLLHDVGKGVSSEISPRSNRIIHPDHEAHGRGPVREGWYRDLDGQEMSW